MRIAKVIGNAYATLKHEKLKGIKLMIVQPINPDGDINGEAVIVADYLNTAVGNLVFWIGDGSTICNITGERSIPLRGCILGIIDVVDMKNKGKFLEG